ncbi:MAG: hypothetical protein K1X37_12110, partial [Saprospiraceae bacterium]|nr:hypothetical protein [Saprospiraceae bacterium]
MWKGEETEYISRHACSQAGGQIVLRLNCCKVQLLGRLLENISPFSIRGNTDCRIENICIDSRKVSKSSLFIAIKGTLTDGHK